MVNYPIRFKPILKEKIWGGKKLGSILNKTSNSENIGESWEISGVPGNISIVTNGSAEGISLKELIAKYKGDLVGEAIYKQFNNDFPLLIKFIDAKTDLSVQLHPNDDLARERHDSFGKTEMWYVLQVDKGSKLNIGFKKTLNKEEYLCSLNKGEIVSLLHFEEVKPGDAVFINTGKVHAIGGGVLLAEIQQTSDVTYRIYDWDRTDDQGYSRELHTELALDAIDFELKDNYKLLYKKKNNGTSQVATCPYFTTNHVSVTKKIKKDYTGLDSFVIYICVEGTAIIDTGGQRIEIKKGETTLIPAACKNLILESDSCELLEVYIS